MRPTRPLVPSATRSSSREREGSVNSSTLALRSGTLPLLCTSTRWLLAALLAPRHSRGVSAAEAVPARQRAWRVGARRKNSGRIHQLSSRRVERAIAVR
jgi:hypothetical protein